MSRVRYRVSALLGAAMLAAPMVDTAVAARHPKQPHQRPPKKKAARPKAPTPPTTTTALAPPQPTVDVLTKDVTGPTFPAGEYGYCQVTLTIQKTTTTLGKDVTVTRKITAVATPQIPGDTARTQFISSRAIPTLVRETLQAQSADIDNVTGATYTSRAFISSLQAALLLAQQV